MPASISVRLSGVVECDPDGCPLGECSDLNAVHNLPQSPSGLGCYYRASLDACGEGYGSIQLRFLEVAGNKVRVRGRVWESDILSAEWWEDIDMDEEGKIDCSSIGSLSLRNTTACGPLEGQAFCIYDAASFEVL